MKIPSNTSLSTHNNFQLFLSINLRSYRAEVNAILRQSLPILKQYQHTKKSEFQKVLFWYDYAKRKANTIKIQIKKLENTTTNANHLDNNRVLEEKLNNIEVEVKKLKKRYITFIRKMTPSTKNLYGPTP